MTDRELLEMAAKAAGYEFLVGGEWHNKGNPGIIIQLPYGRDWVAWNPLTDDGDALRLTVKLGLETGFMRFYRGVWVSQPWKNVQATEDVAIGYGIEQATRRAIVRAAAEIGRSMP